MGYQAVSLAFTYWPLVAMSTPRPNLDFPNCFQAPPNIQGGDNFDLVENQ